jgi:hypothetical protein
MYSVSAIFLFAFVAQTNAESGDSLADTLVDRALRSSVQQNPVDTTNLDSTTSAKSGHLKIPVAGKTQVHGAQLTRPTFQFHRVPLPNPSLTAAKEASKQTAVPSMTFNPPTLPLSRASSIVYASRGASPTVQNDVEMREIGRMRQELKRQVSVAARTENKERARVLARARSYDREGLRMGRSGIRKNRGLVTRQTTESRTGRFRTSTDSRPFRTARRNPSRPE